MTGSQPIARMSHTQSYPFVVAVEMRRNRTQPIVTRVGPSDFYSHLGWRKFDFIVEHHEISQIELRVLEGLLHGAAGLVHVRRRLEQHDALAIERAFRGLALKTTAPWCETMTPCDFVNGHEPDVVPVLRVFRAGITEANKQAHDAASRVLVRWFRSSHHRRRQPVMRTSEPSH